MLSNARALLILEQTEISQHSSFLIHLKTAQPKDADVPNSVVYVLFFCVPEGTQKDQTQPFLQFSHLRIQCCPVS